MTTKYVEKLNKLEQELTKLKKQAATPKNIISLKGVLKGVNITEQDIAKAKKSLFKATKS